MARLLVETSVATGIGYDQLAGLDVDTLATYVDVLNRQSRRKGR